LTKDVRDANAQAEKKPNKTAQAKQVGALIAKACLAKEIDKVVFDRNGYKYHGVVKAVAEGARKTGLKF
jgi:large subunit ribosomal protein L18